jgi:hypothetical protein
MRACDRVLDVYKTEPDLAHIHQPHDRRVAATAVEPLL